MEIQRDDLIVTYDASTITIDDILDVCKSTGFPASVVVEPVAELKTEGRAITVETPEFFTDALAKAKKELKPLVLDFSAAWCAPCQKMTRDVFPDPRVATLLEGFVFLTIDTDEYPELAQEFGVVGIPDIRILSPQGKELRKILGFRDATAFAEVLEKIK